MAGKDQTKLGKRERLALLKETYRLIRKPETWVEGKWKCPIMEYDPEAGRSRPAVDKKGRPQFSYCVEGALNQSAVNLFGIDRAIKLGALSDRARLYDEEFVFGVDGCALFEMQTLGADTSLDTMADEIFGDAFREATGDKVNMMGLNDTGGFGHAAVLKVLRKKIKVAEAEVERLDARKAVAV